MNIVQKSLKTLFWCGLFAGLGIVMITASAYLYLSPKLPPAEDYRNVRLVNPLRIYTSDEKLIAEFGEVRRDPIKYAEIPPLLIDALIASEDSRFYQHNGVDLRALARSVLGILTGNPSGGGSTLTMQLAKNISFEGESPYSRKFKEILLALKIERELNKEEILELYLNRIFFGISAYGISAASSQFYNKPPSELTLAEMAMLVALLPAPNTINPLRSEERALTFRSRVLRRMNELGMITRSQLEEANNAPLTAQRYGVETEVEAPYIAEMVRLEMQARYGDLALMDGFEVFTTVHSETQALANQALTDGLENYDRNHGYRGPENRLSPVSGDGASNEMWLSILGRTSNVGDQMPAFVSSIEERSFNALLRNGETITVEWDGIRWAKRFINNSTWTSSPRSAREVVEVGDLVRVTRNIDGRWMLGQVPAANGGLVSVDPNSGAILALIGGYDFFQSNFNRVTQARRQPGSNFKPFLYAAALENGYTAASLVNDAPLDRSDYRPENFSGEFLGPITLKYALTNSKNLVSLRLYDALGEDVVLPYISRFGFNENEFPRNDLTIAIGSHAVTPLEIVTGYAVFANGGHKVNPYLIERINNFNDGNVYQADPAVVCQIPCNPEPELDGPPGPVSYPAPRVIDESVAYIMNNMLRSVVTDGSGRRINREIGRPDLAGKTGTTNDNFDLWFSGFNGDMVTTVYVGFDNPQTLGRDEQAATVAVPIWIDFMEDALEGMPVNSMQQPDGIVTVRINPETGERALPNEAGAVFEVFREENLPPESGTQNPGAINPDQESGQRIF